MKKENIFDALNSHPYLIGSYGFFANNRSELERRIFTNNKKFFGYLNINYKDPFYRFVLNGKGYEMFYKVDSYIPKNMEIE